MTVVRPMAEKKAMCLLCPRSHPGFVSVQSARRHARRAHAEDLERLERSWGSARPRAQTATGLSE
jgi:hypothetical protein